MAVHPYSQVIVDRAVAKAREVTQTEEDPYGHPLTRCAIQMLVQEIDRLQGLLDPEGLTPPPTVLQ